MAWASRIPERGNCYSGIHPGIDTVYPEQWREGAGNIMPKTLSMGLQISKPPGDTNLKPRSVFNLSYVLSNLNFSFLVYIVTPWAQFSYLFSCSVGGSPVEL